MVAVVQLWARPHVFTDGLSLITLESYTSGSKDGMCEGQTKSEGVWNFNSSLIIN